MMLTRWTAAVVLAGLLVMGADRPLPKATSAEEILARLFPTPKLYKISAASNGAPTVSVQACMGAAQLVAGTSGLGQVGGAAGPAAGRGCTETAEQAPDGSLHSELACTKAAGAKMDARVVTDIDGGAKTIRQQMQVKDDDGPVARFESLEATATQAGDCPADLEPGQMRADNLVVNNVGKQDEQRERAVATPGMRSSRAARASAQPGIGDSEQGPLGSYGSLSTYCGKGPIPRNPPNLPWIGCFVVTAGHVVTGAIGGHRVAVSVDLRGVESFNVDGVTVEDRDTAEGPRRGTNLRVSDVKPSLSGYGFSCNKGGGCATTIDVFGRRPDKSVLWTISQCGPAPIFNVCALSRENYDDILQDYDPATGAHL
jgi:hypothetical protein